MQSIIKPDQASYRAGKYVRQPSGYYAFIPKPLPYEPPVKMDNELLDLLSKADRALGRLDGAASGLPNEDLFIHMYVRKEAVFSSQIEGTQSSLTELLELESNVRNPQYPDDAQVTANYVTAMNYGLERLKESPLSLRLIREIHGLLMQGVRGNEKSPGELRKSQNWVGEGNTGIENAIFVPPPPDEMIHAIGELEKFLHDEKPMPILIKVGLAHAQFETIHPFLDGNGRVGRLLITFLLCEKEILYRPLLYLSYYFKQHRTEYYNRLQAIRDSGDLENWLKFFLRGVALVSNHASKTARDIIDLREKYRFTIQGKLGKSASNALSILEDMFYHPTITARVAMKKRNMSFAGVKRILEKLVSIDVLRAEQHGREKIYLLEDYIKLLIE